MIESGAPDARVRACPGARRTHDEHCCNAGRSQWNVGEITTLGKLSRSSLRLDRPKQRGLGSRRPASTKSILANLKIANSITDCEQDSR